MPGKPVRIPGPDHPITITPTPGRVVVKVAGRVVADSSAALTLQEASYAPVQYIPRADVDMDASRPTRRALIEKHAGTGSIVMPHHFATPCSGTIERAGAGFSYTPIAGS